MFRNPLLKGETRNERKRHFVPELSRLGSWGQVKDFTKLGHQGKVTTSLQFFQPTSRSIRPKVTIKSVRDRNPYYYPKITSNLFKCVHFTNLVNRESFGSYL